MRFPIPLLLALTLVLFSGCKRVEPEAAPTPKPARKSPPVMGRPEQTLTGKPEPWASSPKTEWPQIVLTNHATFKGHTPLDGASAFLLKTPKGIVAATAKHLIGINGGVEPEIDLKDFNTALESWVLHPRTRPEEFLTVAALAIPPNAPQWFDWLLLRLEKTKDAPLLFTALQPRSAPVTVGEQVYLIGVSYDEPDVAQKVYSCKVTRRPMGDRFAYDLDPPVNIRGFSGAPIVDANGWLVGVMTVFFEPRMNGDLFLEAGGEDAATVLKVINQMTGK